MHHTKKLIAGVLLILGVVLGFRLGGGGPEDTWICQDGVWIAHGSPSQSMPSTPCGVVSPSASTVACTMDAKICPDGSSVGRTGPNCSFAPCPAERMKTISLFAYDARRDTDTSGNIMCGAAGLVAVSRSVPVTTTPIQDALVALLRSGLTDSERAQGLTSEFPLLGVSLSSVALKDGMLTIALLDPQSKTSGGSCRISILRSQVEATARQFGGVRGVRFVPEELFQP